MHGIFPEDEILAPFQIWLLFRQAFLLGGQENRAKVMRIAIVSMLDFKYAPRGEAKGGKHKQVSQSYAS